MTVTVRDIDQTGPVIDAAAAAAGDNLTVGGVTFYVDDVEALIGAARADAIGNASKRAGEYADAAGVTVGGVLQISEDVDQQPGAAVLRSRSRFRCCRVDADSKRERRTSRSRSRWCTS